MAALLVTVRPIGTHSGVPVTGIGDHARVAGRRPRARAPRRRSPPAAPAACTTPVAQRDEVVRVAAGVVEVVQDDADRAALLVEVREQVEHLELVGEVEVGRRLVEQQDRACPARAPSRSRRAGAGRRRAGRAGGRAGRRCRSRCSAHSTRSRSSALERRPSRWCGKRPRCTRSSTVSPSGGTGDCGRNPSRRATSRVGSDAIAAPSSSTAPALGFSSRANARSSVDLPRRVGADDRRDPARPGAARRRPCRTSRSP